jgi:hypothetical protein
VLEIRSIIPDSPAINATELEATIQAILDSSANEVKQEFEKTVASWAEKPEFVVESAQFTRQIYTVNQVYDWVNNGTVPHAIFPVNKLALRFAIDGSPKTVPGFLGSGNGSKGSTFVFSRGVYNPGVTARDFDVTIAEEWSERLPDRMQAAIDQIK